MGDAPLGPYNIRSDGHFCHGYGGLGVAEVGVPFAQRLLAGGLHGLYHINLKRMIFLLKVARAKKERRFANRGMDRLCNDA